MRGGRRPISGRQRPSRSPRRRSRRRPLPARDSDRAATRRQECHQASWRGRGALVALQAHDRDRHRSREIPLTAWSFSGSEAITNRLGCHGGTRWHLRPSLGSRVSAELLPREEAVGARYVPQGAGDNVDVTNLSRRSSSERATASMSTLWYWLSCVDGRSYSMFVPPLAFS